MARVRYLTQNGGFTLGEFCDLPKNAFSGSIVGILTNNLILSFDLKSLLSKAHRLLLVNQELLELELWGVKKHYYLVQGCLLQQLELWGVKVEMAQNFA